MKARNLRRLVRNGWGAKDMGKSALISCSTTMTRRGRRFCARLLSLREKCELTHGAQIGPFYVARWEGEQFRSAIPGGPGDHDARDEHLLSLFQIL
jgi:hypothetical protein